MSDDPLMKNFPGSHKDLRQWYAVFKCEKATYLVPDLYSYIDFEAPEFEFTYFDQKGSSEKITRVKRSQIIALEFFHWGEEVDENAGKPPKETRPNNYIVIKLKSIS